jgi:hypothetical protein
MIYIKLSEIIVSELSLQLNVIFYLYYKSQINSWLIVATPIANVKYMNIILWALENIFFFSSIGEYLT